MRYKFILIAFAYSLTMSVSAEITFYESFDGFKEGTKAKDNVANPADTPILWADEAYTSVGTIASLRMMNGLQSISETTNPKITKDTIARTGSAPSALLFKYRAGPNSWSEQRFKINPQVLLEKKIKGLNEFWLQYDIFIPKNYQIVDDTPTSSNYFGAGHKVFSLYADAYSHPNTTFVLGGLIARKGSDGKTAYDGNVYQMSTLSTYVAGERIYTQFGIDERKREKKWIDVNRDLGTWQRRTLHFKFPTSKEANDGVIEFWIRRADGSIMKLIDLVSGTFYGDTQNYFNAGYINGFYNAGFPEETFLVVDNFILSTVPDNIDVTALSAVNRPIGPIDFKKN